MIESINPYIDTRETRYGVFSFLKGDSPIGDSLRDYGEWGALEVDILTNFIRLDDTILDIGANIGTHTSAFANLVGPRGRVISFEPQPVFFELLRRNVYEHNRLSWVDIHQCGISSCDGVLEIPNIDISKRANFAGISLTSAGVGVPTTKITLRALDSLFIDRVDLAKIDVEGMEAEVLLGARELFQRSMPVLQMEINDLAHAASLLHLLQEMKYFPFVMTWPAFNPDNFNHLSNNWFGVAHESAILAIPPNNEDFLAKARTLADSLEPVTTMEELADAFLRTPRHGDLTPIDRNHRKLSERIEELERQVQTLSNERERVDFFKSRAIVLEDESKKLHARILELINEVSRVDNLTVELNASRDALVKTEKILQSVLNSKSWQVTAPLRALMGFLR